MRKIYLGLVMLMGIVQSHAQAPENSLLWEISGNGLKESSWIFGTFHIMCKSDFSISQELSDKIKSAGAFYGELKLDDPGMQAAAMKRMMMTDKSLEMMIGEKDYPAVSQKFAEINGGMQLKMFDHFKPFMAESMLALNMVSCKDNIQPETEFMKIAQENKKPVYGLETIDDQMNAIDKQPLDSQVRDLTLTILRYDSVKTQMQQMIHVYKLRNIDSIYRFMKTNSDNGDFEANMISNRNKNWIPVIEKASAVESIFYAVGAGHLGGPDGVINLLRKRGYKLTPVKY